MNRGENVLFNNALADENGVFKVVTVPGHERHEHIAAQGQLPALGARAISDELAFFHRVAFADENFLVNASRGVGAHELADLVNPNSLFGVVLDPLLAFGQLAVGGDDDLVAGNGSDFAALFRDDDRARVACDALFQASGDQWRFRREQRNGLALHV